VATIQNNPIAANQPVLLFIIYSSSTVLIASNHWSHTCLSAQ